MREHSFLGGQIVLHSGTGALRVTLPTPGEPIPEGQTTLDGTTASLDYDLGAKPCHLALAGSDVSFGVGEDLVTLSCSDDSVRIDWNWKRVGDTLESWVDVTNHTDRPIRVNRLLVLQAEAANLPGPVAEWRFYQNGWQTGAPTGVRRIGDGPFPVPAGNARVPENLPHGDGLRSEWVTVLSAPPIPTPDQEAPGARPSPGQRHLLLGFVTAADQLAEVLLETGGESPNLAAICYTDGLLLEPGRTLSSERLQLAAGRDGWALLEAWAERMGELMLARVPEKPPTGWCTWYYYFARNTAQDVYANLNAMRRRHLPLDVVMIDDGYQAAIGDWLTLDPNRFTDMASLTATIRREGRTPGIWVAPFGLADNSQTWASHPEWALRDEAGKPVVAWHHRGQAIYALDTTHPEASDWLHATFHTMRRKWGYDCFKADFLFAAAMPGRHHDPQTTRAQALRRGLSILRDAIGNDAFLLGCGVPLGPAVGLVDGTRIGPDVSLTWEPSQPSHLSAPGTANAMRNSIARAFTHRRLWAADPDCLLARPRGDNSQLSLYEARSLATVLVLSGGLLLDSDRLSSLPPARLAMLRQTLPPTNEAARPLDLFRQDLPEILILPVERPWGRWWVVGIINWGDRTRDFSLEAARLDLPTGAYHVYDQWRQDYLGQMGGGSLPLRQRPHETSLLLLKPTADRPEWLTSTFHLAAGSVEVVDLTRQRIGERRQKIIVRLEQRGEHFGRLVFSVPEGWVVLDAQVNGRRRSVNIRAGEARLVDMGFTLHDRGWVLVDFARL
jgi:alpha-galactosidase